MADYNNISFYSGAGYGMISGYKEPFINTKERPSPGEFGLPTDPRTANQIEAVSKKLSTGARVIEVSGVTPEMFEALPQQHLKEINRLKKLAGAELTFHGPLVEPTGVSRRGWDESQRVQAERQMWSAVKRSHDLEPDGNIVVTFHSSNGLPEPEVIEFNEKGERETKQIWAVNERTGDFQPIGPPQKEYFEKKGEVITPKDVLDKQNKDAWFKSLQSVSFHATNGQHIIEETIPSATELEKGLTKSGEKKSLQDYYKDYTKGRAEETLQKIPDKGLQDLYLKTMGAITHGDIYLRDAYQDLKNLYNQAYDSAEKSKQSNNPKERAQAEDALHKLNKFREEIAPLLKDIEDPAKIDKFGQEIVNGVNILRSIEPPKLLRPLKEFAIDKASDTFSNLAFQSYKEFKGTAPIISIENPPAGSGLSRAEDLKELVEASREKFVERHKELGLSKREAEEQAKKLIGVTWDVGHINMLRKYGAEDKQLVEQTKTIAPLVKHVHLSDNFGMEHTELPMGMGNVPTKKMLDLISQYNAKAKKIIETGGPWYQFFQKSPLKETFEAFGSPIYPMKMSPQWNQIAASSGGYFSGYGRVLPDVHFSTYGAGFSQLPTELGGQMLGRGSRMSGNPME